MRTCPITYEEINELKRYSHKGLSFLAKGLNEIKDFPYTNEEQWEQARLNAMKISIQGMQPKLSVVFSKKERSFKIVEKSGKYILKPQSPSFKSLPENEGLTMKMAEISGIKTPLHGLIYCKGGGLSYFIKRFDRIGQNRKLPVEDFAQLSGKTRETKYDSSMENIVKVIKKFCTFPAVENIKLFKRTLFSYLVGNEDMHLKNFSLITTQEGITRLSPAYDLVSSKLVLKNSEEDLALPIRGRKNRLKKNDLIDYFAIERMSIPKKVVQSILKKFSEAVPLWKKLIEKSFLPQEYKSAYEETIDNRLKILGF